MFINGKRCQASLTVIYDVEEEEHKVTKIGKITHTHPETSSCEMAYEIESTKIKESFLVLNENVVSIDNSKKKYEQLLANMQDKFGPLNKS